MGIAIAMLRSPQIEYAPPGGWRRQRNAAAH